MSQLAFSTSFETYVMGLRPLEIFQFFHCGLYTPESDVCRRQFLTYKDDPRTERVKILFFLFQPHLADLRLLFEGQTKA